MSGLALAFLSSLLSPSRSDNVICTNVAGNAIMTSQLMKCGHLILLCLWGGLSCRNNDFRTESFVLQDSTTVLEIAVPNELDTFHVWVDKNDTRCGDEIKYRFSNSLFPVFEESGFFYAIYPDSSYRLTVSHLVNLECDKSPWPPDLEQMAKGLEARSKHDSVEFIMYSTEHKNIQGIDFYTIRFKTDLLPEQAYQSTVIRSFFHTNGINLKVEFECASNNCDRFIERMNKSLESIRVSKNM